MRKSDLIAALERIHGDPEIAVKLISRKHDEDSEFIIDHINEIPRPEIVIIES